MWAPTILACLWPKRLTRMSTEQLVLDIGTNGEILLGNKERMLSASSPTGPAFEGAEIRHGMRVAPGAIERVRVDPATLAVRYKIIGNDAWIESKRTPPVEDNADGLELLRRATPPQA